MRHQAERKLVTGVVQEVLKLQEGHPTQLPPVPPVNPDLQLTCLCGEWGVASAAREWPPSLQPTANPDHTKAGLTRSKEMLKAWSQDFSATGAHPV